MKLFFPERKQLDKLILRFADYRVHQILLGSFLLLFINSWIFSYLLSEVYTNKPEFTSITDEIITALLLAPLLETYIFHYFVIRQSMHFFNQDKLLAILLSATLFGLAHSYSWPYMLKTFFSGLVYATLYFVFTDKKRYPFLYICLLHASYNALATTINLLSGP